MPQSIRLWGATYSDVPYVDLPKSTTGTARFTDTTPTTANDADVAQGKVYFKADGSQSTGTASGGVTPTGNIDITSAGTTDVTQYATATVAQGDVYASFNQGYKTVSGARKWTVDAYATVETGDDYGSPGFIEDGYYEYGHSQVFNAIPTGTSVTPTESAQTIGGANTMMEGAVTVNAIPSTYVGTGITRRSSSDLTASGATVSVPSGFYENNASKAIASGSATARATKGVVSNNSITVTPSVTTTAGYVTAGTSSGTAVTIRASELVGGSQTITQNGVVDVTNLASVTVAVGGGASDAHVGYSDNSFGSESSILFNTNGRPTSCIVYAKGDIPPLSGVSQISAIVWDGGEYSSNNHVQTITNTANAQVTYVNAGAYPNVQSDSIAFYSNENGREFADITYGCIYSYGTTAIVDTKTQSVGSGATSITFTGLTKRPIYFACIFTSNFSTSSGYQRVIAVGGEGGDCYGLEMDSSAHYSTTHWSYTDSNSSLTITSQGTNAGGYFHQPGDYLLVYAYDGSDSEEYQTKNVTYTPTTQTQTQSVTADSGYDALEAVNVTVNPIPNEYIIPTGNLAITQNGNNINVSQYATVSVNVSGGGGDEKNTQVVQGTTRTTSSTLTAIGAELTVSKTGTYDVYWSAFRSSTSSSYTYGTRLYVGGTAYGTENTTWSNHVQNNHLTGVSLTANQKVRVYGRNSRGSSYYIYAPTLVIVET